MPLARATLVLAVSAGSVASAAPAVGSICDTPDRIFVVSARLHGHAIVGKRESRTALAGSVIVISRKTGKRVRGPLAAGSAAIDDCGGEEGGHAGCSEFGGWGIKSRVLGKDELFFGTYRRDMLVHGDTFTECRDSDEEPWLALCSTKSWFAVVGTHRDRPFLRIYVAGDEPIAEDVEDETDGRYTGTRATVSVDKASGSVELDGKREACLAMYQSPAS
jgi:hypothetical protein